MATTSYIPRKSNPIADKLKIRFDVWLAFAVSGLVIAGMMTVYSASYDVAFRSGLSNNNHAFYLQKQFNALFLGLVGLVVLMQFDYHRFKMVSIPALLGTLALLVLVLLFGEDSFGARRSIFGVQPSEFAKVTTILYISHWLASKGDRVKSLVYGLVPFAMIIGLICFLISRQPDLSTSILVFGISFTLFFLAGADWRQFAAALVLAAVAFTFLMFASAHAADRFEGWRAMLEDPSNAHWQVRLALASLANGGLTGQGIGRGEVKYFLPAAHTDGVFAVWGEEVGIIGGLFVIVSFGFIVWRGIVIARSARDSYGYLLAMGVTVWIAYQALINIAVITASIPFTGIPLPFMSYGGTSLAVSLVSVGILLNISRDQAIGRTLAEQPKTNLESWRETLNLRRWDGRSRLPGARRSRRPAPSGSE